MLTKEEKNAKRRAKYANDIEYRLRVRAIAAKHREANRPDILIKQRKYQNENREKIRADLRETWADPAKWPRHACYLAKQRAKKKGLEFSLTPADIVIPALCPVLSVPFVFGQRHVHNPSLDRKDNSLGYCSENVRVISYRANQIKNDANLEELRALVRYLEEDDNET